MLDKVYHLRRNESKTFPNAAERLLSNYRVAIVELSCSWCTDTTYLSRSMDSKNIKDLLSAFISMVHRPA